MVGGREKAYKSFYKTFHMCKHNRARKYKKKLKKQLRNIYLKISKKPPFQNLVDGLRNKLKQVEMNKAKRAKIHAIINWETEGEKCTKYFLQKQEKSKNADQAILSLKKQTNGEILKEQNKILDQVENFFRKNYIRKNKLPIFQIPLIISILKFRILICNSILKL